MGRLDGYAVMGRSSALCLRMLCRPCRERFLGTVNPLRPSPSLPTSYARNAFRPWSSSQSREASTNRRGGKEKEADRLPDNYYTSARLARDLRNLGFQSISAVVQVLRRWSVEMEVYQPANAIRILPTNRRLIAAAEEVLGSHDSALIRKPQVIGKAFRALGRNHLEQQNRRVAEPTQATHLFQMAFAAGETDAALDAARVELLNIEARSRWSPTHGLSLSPQIAAYVRERALRGDDWRAISHYLWDSVKRSQPKTLAKQNYQLAKRLFQMFEPSKTEVVDRIPLWLFYEQPWKLLHDAADHYLSHIPHDPISDSVQADLDQALRVGAFDYQDPRAVSLALGQKDLIRKHSKEWWELTTQSAVQGYPDSCLDIALYHLREDGWRPSKPNNQKSKGWLGIEWLGVSAACADADPKTMLQRYLGLAHLLRENGYVDEGHAWMKTAQENVAEAGLDPKGEWNAYVDSFLETWYDDNVPQRSSEEFLGPVE